MKPNINQTDIYERSWHEFFELGIIIKGIDGILELAGGIVLFFISPDTINTVARFFIQGELSEDPKNFLANLLLHATQGLIQTQIFASILLVVHGVIKIALVIALRRNKFWAYPTAIIIFGGFVFYQFYQLSVGYSLFLWVVTIIDIAVVGLIIHEYRYMRRRAASHAH